MLQVRCAHPTGNFAPKRLFKSFRCFAWLIKTREHTVLSLSQTLMLQVRCAHPSGVFAPKRPFGNVPVLRSAFFPQRVRSTLCSKTLDLQVRCANPTGIFAPKRLFKSFRCFAWLIRIKEHTVLFYSKRSCFRFAALTLWVFSHRNAPSGHSGSKGTGSRKRVIPPAGSSS